jgi:hypothetical protein
MHANPTLKKFAVFAAHAKDGYPGKIWRISVTRGPLAPSSMHR